MSDILFGAGLFLLGGDMTTDEIDLWVSIEQVLTPEEFRLFKMRYAWKMTQRQIAEGAGCCQKTISNHMKNIKQKLQKTL